MTSLRRAATRCYAAARDPTTKYGGKSLEAAIRHCVALVKENDDEFFKWATYTMQKSKTNRAPILVMKALQLEIESIQYAARTETLLRMRYQWWRDSIAKAFAATKSYEMAQPVMKACSELVQSYPCMSQKRVQEMLDAYEMDAMRGETCFQRMDDLEGFARDSTGALVALQMEACGMGKDSVEAVAPSLGVGIGMTSALRRSLGLLSEYGISYLPEDVCWRHGIDPGAFFDGKDKREALKGVARDIAVVAREHLDAANAAARAVGGGTEGNERSERNERNEAKAFALQGLASELWLQGLEKTGYDLLTTGGVSPVEYLLKLRWKSLQV